MMRKRDRRSHINMNDCDEIHVQYILLLRFIDNNKKEVVIGIHQSFGVCSMTISRKKMRVQFNLI